MYEFEIAVALGALLFLALLYITQLRSKLSAAQDKIASLPSPEVALEVTRLNTILEQERKATDEKLKVLEEAKTRLLDSFKALSADALKSNNEQFLNLARESFTKSKAELEKKEQAFTEMVKPLKDSLSKVDEKISLLEKTRLSAYQSITEQLKSQQEIVGKLSSETSGLSRALRAPNVRGRWGEMQLRRVVELAGMIEHCDFTEQASTGTIKPDMIVNLPGGKKVIIDAKAPLEAYLDALEESDDTRRASLVKAHARQVRDHIKTLGSKDYWKQFPSAPEFVVLFLPGEIFFSSALEADPHLIDFGVEQKVILATPTTLIALLKAVAYGWHQQDVTEYAIKISEEGKVLFDRIGKVAEHFEKLRGSISSVNKHYNAAVGSLERNVYSSARKLQELGVSKSADIPSAEQVDAEPRELLKIGE